MGNRVVLGVSGSIAAFKAAALASELVQRGHEVRVLLTPGGERFISPLTFQGITGHPVAGQVWDESGPGSAMGHIEMGKWAEILVVAPASAGAIARLALGLPADMLGAVALIAACPLLIAPAMESGMWEHLATQAHVRTLRERGAIVVGPGSGRLASGSSGTGRMVEPAEIRDEIERILGRKRDLAGVRVLVTAGPTYETIDPVRYIGNRSSGKMGYAVAEEARNRGASVSLITGPTSLPVPPGMDVVQVESHAQMREAVLRRVHDQDVVVMAAAVADFTPAETSGEKIERRDGLELALAPTSDIAAEASREHPDALHIGFALETGDLAGRAREKMLRKGQNMVVGNAITSAHNPFGSDTNRVIIMTADETVELPERSKRDVAAEVWNAVIRLRPTLRLQDRANQ